MLKKRHLWADIVRLIAIFFVLAVHLSELHFPLNFYNYFNLTVLIIALSGVPIFVILSGAFLLNKKENAQNILRKRILRLIMPWFFWAFIYTLVYLYQHDSFNPAFFINTLRSSILSFWFLPMILGLYLLTPALRLFVQNAKSADLVYIIVFWFLIVSFMPFTRNTLAFPKHTDNGFLRQVVNFSGYYLLGDLLINKAFINFISLIPSLIISLTGILLVLTQVSIYFLVNNRLDNSYLAYHSPGIIITSIGAFILLYNLAKRVKVSIKYQKLIESASSLSLGIYLSHALVKNILTTNLAWYPLNHEFVLSGILNTLFLFSVCYFLLSVLNRVKFLDKFLG